MKALVDALNQDKALVWAFPWLWNLREPSFEALQDTWLIGGTVHGAVQGSPCLHLSSQAGYLHHLADTALTLLTQLPCMSESSSVICTLVTPLTHRNMLSLELSKGGDFVEFHNSRGRLLLVESIYIYTSAFTIKTILGPSTSIVKFRLPVDVVVLSCWPWIPCHWIDDLQRTQTCVLAYRVITQSNYLSEACLTLHMIAKPISRATLLSW